MCGVAGVLRLDGQAPDAARVFGMTRALRHRGPDDIGTWRSGPIVLGNCRLSIIDIGESGHQPLTNEDGTVAITYNGEVYNYKQLRGDLQAAGHTFRSATDTEVLVHAYEHWGLDHFLDRVNGIFAFALWDSRRRRLVVARDRLGVKRIYIRSSASEVAFASEIGPLVAGMEDRSINTAAVDAYFAFGYVPEPVTIWSSIRAVPPGAVEIWENGHRSAARYWRLRENSRDAPNTLTEAAQAVHDALGTAVERQLVSDVPVGLFLSGGVDSLAVASFAAQAPVRPIAFTVGFEDVDFDETERASRSAKVLGLEHSVEVIQPHAWETVLNLVSHFGQPFADASAVPVAAISSVAARTVKVVLTGDGGDELFGGYETYSASQLAGAYGRLPAVLRNGAERIADFLPVSHGRLDFGERARRFTAVAGRPTGFTHAYWRQYFSASERLLLFKDRQYCRPGGADEILAPVIAAASEFHGLNRFLAFDTMSYLPSDMLCKVDIASMMHSLEARVPFLDHDLVELAFSLRPVLKRRGIEGKRVLKAALSKMVPAELLQGTKRGFNVPVARWLAEPLRLRLDETLDPHASSAMALFNLDYVDQLRREHTTKRRDHSFKLWALIVFVMWYESSRNVSD
jgi:asparagine synthase (glutamine-hydrolysing)